jgi:signal transduction histidine kinase
MKLARKMVFGLLTGVIAVLLVSAWLRVLREVEQFDSDMQRDDLLVGRAIATGVSRTWRFEGEQAGLDFIRAFSGQEHHVQVRWVWLDGSVRPENSPRLPVDELGPVRAGREFAQRSRELGYQLTYLPLTTPSGRHGALEISESLDGERAYVRRSVWNAALTTAALVAVAAVLAAILGGVLVGRPVHQLVSKVRRIATGDLGSPLVLQRGDELGELANAINQMCEALATANADAAREAAARVAAIEQLRHADRLTTVGKLASGIAHELGTPLNIVSGRGYMIASGEASGEEIKENARIIMEQSERITRIIRQLLDFARPRPVEKVRTDLHALAAQTVSLLRPMAEKQRVQLALLEPETPALVVADPGQVQQVITNLVVNSIQASENGGMVTVGFKRESAAEGSGEERPPSLCLYVRDTGQGMDPETRARIFDPFFTTKEVGAGTGLGLSIAYGIVRDHRGWIDVESAPGRGTTISIHLPLGEGGPEPRAEVGRAAPLPLRARSGT